MFGGIFMAVFLVLVIGASIRDMSRRRSILRVEAEQHLPTTLRELGWRPWLRREFALLNWRSRLTLYMLGLIVALAALVQTVSFVTG